MRTIHALQAGRRYCINGSYWGDDAAGVLRCQVQQGLSPLLSYLYHQHSKLFLDGVLTFKADNGTQEHSKPLFMEPSAPYVQSPLII